MAVQATWIRQNMFPNYDENSRLEISSNRRLTEAEIKVQKSLEKLSIPEWYLNNSSHPPKILKNDLPIDCRPASWKNGIDKEKLSVSASLLSPKNFKGSNKSVSSVMQNLNRTYTKHNPQQKNIHSQRFNPGSTLQIVQNGTLERKTAKMKKRLNTSGTFPRMSVSKKIQNINIVFPQPSKLDLSIDEEFETAPESAIIEDLSIMNKSVMVTDLDDPDPECLRACNLEKTYVKPSSPKKLPKLEFPQMPCRTPDFNSPALMNFKFRTASTPEGSPVSIFSTSQLDSPLCHPIRPSPKKNYESAFTYPQGDASPLAKPLRQDSPNHRKEAISTYTKIEKQSDISESSRVSPRSQSPGSDGSEKLEICDACKENVRIRLIMVSPLNKSPRNSPTFRSPLMPITENQKATISRQNSAASSNVAFIMSKKKSTAMENIIKKKRKGGKSLIQEIIEDLEEKCRSSPQPTYTSPGSRNFVRKLVRALEKNNIDEDDADTPNYLKFNRETEVCNSESSSEPDIKSAASSTSLSFKDSDSGSDSEPRSPTLSSSEPDYDWAINVHEDEKKLEDEESVFWVPLQKPSLPRTSSMLSMATSSFSGKNSPCISPIRVQNGVKLFQGGNPDAWGTTYRRSKNDQPKRLFRIDESGVLDSGYSDRSLRSSATDAYSTWSDFESTQSPSDMESSSSSFSRSKLSNYRKNVFVGDSIMV